MAKKKKPRYATPVGELLQAFIQRPSTKYSKDPHGEYSILMAFNGEEEGFAEFKEFMDKKLERAIDDLVEEDAKNDRLPTHPLLTEEEDDDGNKTGRWLFRSKQTASYPAKQGEAPQFRPLAVFTAKGNPFPAAKKIGRGTMASVSFTFGNPYAVNNKQNSMKGIGTYLQAVQVIELVEYSGGGADSFGFNTDREDDMDYEDIEDAMPSQPAGTAAGDDEADGDF